MTQDQSKIIVQILNSLRYKPADGKIIFEIVQELEKDIIDVTLDTPTIVISASNIVEINKKTK